VRPSTRYSRGGGSGCERAPGTAAACSGDGGGEDEGGDDEDEEELAPASDAQAALFAAAARTAAHERLLVACAPVALPPGALPPGGGADAFPESGAGVRRGGGGGSGAPDEPAPPPRPHLGVVRLELAVGVHRAAQLFEQGLNTWRPGAAPALLWRWAGRGGVALRTALRRGRPRGGPPRTAAGQRLTNLRRPPCRNLIAAGDDWEAAAAALLRDGDGPRFATEAEAAHHYRRAGRAGGLVAAWVLCWAGLGDTQQLRIAHACS
jgi:hypothetical protein